MDITLYDRDGNPIAYISDDYDSNIYLFEGEAVAYLFNEREVYGINGRHLGWFIDEVLYDSNGLRIGFTHNTCPKSGAKEPIKSKRKPIYEKRPKWKPPPMPKFSYAISSVPLKEFLLQGKIERIVEREKEEEEESE